MNDRTGTYDRLCEIKVKLVWQSQINVIRPLRTYLFKKL